MNRPKPQLLFRRRCPSPTLLQPKVSVSKEQYTGPHLHTLLTSFVKVADVEARQRLRSSSSSSLIVSRTWLPTVGDRAFPVAAVRVWNGLPDLVTSAPSVAVFRSRLKTHLFNISYPCDCTVPAQWLLLLLDTIIVLAYLLMCDIPCNPIRHQLKLLDRL